MAELFANRGEPDKMPQDAASELHLHCLPVTLFGVYRLKWVNSAMMRVFSTEDRF